MVEAVSTHHASALSAFSICIPTFNRAKLLALCLEHLLTFSGNDFELIVGDNASSDNTQEVLQSFAGRFKHLSCVRHKENIGFARNMDALMRRASRQYVYILSDDDFVFEEALHMVHGIFSAQPEVVAVVGKYLSHTTLDSSCRVDYSNAVATILEQGAHTALLENFIICDGHPFIRRATFQRHCAYWNRTIGLIPLYFRLLSFGKLIVVDKPLFQHLTNSESLSGSMSEAWFLDMCHADFELALTGDIETDLRSRLGGVRDALLRLVYFQAVRMAHNKKEHLAKWMFLRRLDAVGGASPALLVQVEFNYIHDFLMSRLVQIIGDGCFEKIRYSEQSVFALLIPELKSQLPDCIFVDLDSDITKCHAEWKLTLDDLFAQLKLSAFSGKLIAQGRRVVVSYEAAQAAEYLLDPSASFEVLNTRYAADFETSTK
jgi:Glycosyl transferase family 2